MTDAVTGIAGIGAEISPSTIESDKNELGQDEFLKLMLAQLRHQDPLKPVENTEFIAQTAQFSTVSGINSMRDSLDEFVKNQNSAQALNSANLLGKAAMISGNTAVLGVATPLMAEYELPHYSETTMASIIDENGVLIKQIPLGAKEAGTHSLQWDGSLESGSNAASGKYTIQVEYLNDDNEVTAASTATAEVIESIVFGKSGSEVRFTLSDGRSVGLSDVKEIKN